MSDFQLIKQISADGSLLTSCKNMEKENSNTTTANSKDNYSFNNSNNSLNEKIGVTNWGAVYMPGLDSSDTSLIKGMNYIEELGSKVIKIACGNPSTQYPLDNFSNNFSSSVDVFKEEHFKEVLDSTHFTTYFISVPERNQITFHDGVTKEEREYVSNEFYEMTKYLLNEYQGSGKVFILQNWETDNYISYRLDGENDLVITRRYADYYNARQDGINKARDEFDMTNDKLVKVFGAIEVNKLSDYSKPRAVDVVVPYTYADLYCYSSYEIKDKGVIKNSEELMNKLSELIDYYETKLPDTSNYPGRVYIEGSRICITEFGYPDKADDYNGEWQKMVVEGHLMTIENKNLQYGVYWQLCDNEVVGNAKTNIKNLKYLDLREYEFNPGDLNGFYLIRPDGVKTYTYNYLRNVFENNMLNVNGEIPSAWAKGE